MILTSNSSPSTDVALLADLIGSDGPLDVLDAHFSSALLDWFSPVDDSNVVGESQKSDGDVVGVLQIFQNFSMFKIVEFLPFIDRHKKLSVILKCF